MAVAALIFAVLQLPVVAILLGHWAGARTRRLDRGGQTMARIATALGYAELALAVLFWIFYFAVLAPVLTLPR